MDAELEVAPMGKMSAQFILLARALRHAQETKALNHD